jgi:hypothetical protein
MNDQFISTALQKDHNKEQIDLIKYNTSHHKITQIMYRILSEQSTGNVIRNLLHKNYINDTNGKIMKNIVELCLKNNTTQYIYHQKHCHYFCKYYKYINPIIYDDLINFMCLNSIKNPLDVWSMICLVKNKEFDLFKYRNKKMYKRSHNNFTCIEKLLQENIPVPVKFIKKAIVDNNIPLMTLLIKYDDKLREMIRLVQ